jgi:hypothetical protein
MLLIALFMGHLDLQMTQPGVGRHAGCIGDSKEIGAVLAAAVDALGQFARYDGRGYIRNH